jgi:hypothetical protein
MIKLDARQARRQTLILIDPLRIKFVTLHKNPISNQPRFAGFCCRRVAPNASRASRSFVKILLSIAAWSGAPA